LTRFEVAPFMTARIEDRAPSVIVFATDMIPDTLVDEAQPGGTLMRRYLDSGGKVVWPGGPPLLFTFDPTSGKMPELGPDAAARLGRILGIANAGPFEGASRSRATDLGRRWGLPAGWWIAESPIASPAGSVDVLATDDHGHASAWVRAYGGASGTGFVRCWGRELPIPDPRVVLNLAEYGLR
jgi:hypothetical protein